MVYSQIPKRAEFERRLTGTNEDGGFAEVLVHAYHGKKYATFSLDGFEVCRSQVSGRNLAKLDEQLQELRDGLHDVIEER